MDFAATGDERAVRYPSVRHLKRLPRSLRQRCRFLLPLLRTAGIVLLIIVLARPTRQLTTQELPSKGIAIAMVLDRSGSMGDMDGRLMYNGKLTLRYDVAKDVFEKFVKGDGKDLPGRPNDLIGLFTFATYPRTDHPFSLDHASLCNVVEASSAEKRFLDSVGRETDDPQQARAADQRAGTGAARSVRQDCAAHQPDAVYRHQEGFGVRGGQTEPAG